MLNYKQLFVKSDTRRILEISAHGAYAILLIPTFLYYTIFFYYAMMYISELVANGSLANSTTQIFDPLYLSVIFWFLAFIPSIVELRFYHKRRMLYLNGAIGLFFLGAFVILVVVGLFFVIVGGMLAGLSGPEP